MFLQAKHRTYRELAAHFCEELEDPAATTLSVRSALIALYSASLEMQDETGSDALLDVPERISSEEYAKLKKRIETKLQFDLFSICYHPFKSPPEAPLWVSISDGLADIWRDLKPGLFALEEDEEKCAAAVFSEWKFSFDTHWGDHAVDCIWAIHKLLRDEPMPNNV